MPWTISEAPGVSVFLKDGGQIYHTYSTYTRGLDMLNVAYHYGHASPRPCCPPEAGGRLATVVLGSDDARADEQLPPLQQEIRARCRHPTGAWEPFDGQAGAVSVPARLAAIAARHPDRVAVLEPARSLTYHELQTRTARVAGAILTGGASASGAVAIFSRLDSHAIVATLGALRTGRLFVAPDRSMPLPAQRRVLDDAGVEVILADASHLGAAQDLAGGHRRVLALEDIEATGVEAIVRDVVPETPATIIYTSGTTGRPRGVVHTHRTLLVEAGLAANAIRLSAADRVACLSSLSWLATTWTLLGPLMTGSCVCPFDVAAHGIDRLAAWTRSARLTTINGRVVVRQLLGSEGAGPFPDVRAVTIGGDTIYRREVEACRRTFPNATVITGLATSEAGRVTYLFLDRATPLPDPVVPLGYPVAGKRVRILRGDGGDAEPGEAGEIAVQGRHLAAGYWRQPELTAARLALTGADGERLSLTGDVGRRLADGCIVHLGRTDFQVKIRGYQVPINAVEAALLEVDGVREVVVVADGSGPDERRLVAYVAPRPPEAPGAEALRRALSGLPAHMVPKVFVSLDMLPRTGSGKVARDALPPPVRSRPDLDTPYAPPRDELEVGLADVWASVLDLDAVGIDDRFLDLGGDSLGAMRIASQMLARWGLDLSLAEVLAAATVAEMASAARDHLASHGPCRS
jgi:acyl-coenzyme A synthetase/AMP-(fatty) acid ligase